jgi:transcriptional regulator GlxA family with amidase domain
MAEMEDCLVSLFSLAAFTSDAGSVAHLAAVRRAEDYLLRHLTRPVARSELARAAGVSIRTISRGFREHHGVSPMVWLKERRLEAAQSELRDAVPGEVTVTDVALRYGFENPGRFAAEYRQRFGENPSQTLRH